MIKSSAFLVPPPGPLKLYSRKLFNESRCKLYWARKHAYDFSVQWERFIQMYGDPVKWREFNRLNSTNYPQHHVPVPVEFRLMLSDCIRSLRSSLDYLVSALARQANLPDDKTIFPFAKERQGLETSFRAAIDPTKGKRGRRSGALYDLSIKYKNLEHVILNVIQPYSAADGAGEMGDLVWRVVTTDNIDKHRLILVTVSVSNINDVRTVDGGRIRNARIMGDGIRMGSGEIDPKSDFSVDVLFGKPTSLAGKPITRTLVEALNFTDEIVEIFESHF